MSKIFYFTRSYLPEKTGGALMRAQAVKLFRKNGLETIVVTPNYGKRNLMVENKIIYYPLIYNLQIAKILERVGLLEDYLDKWIKQIFIYLKGMIGKNDILFATSGGELGNLKLASSLKKEIYCRYVANFHDPLDYSLVNGRRIDRKFHVSREKSERKYLSNADLIITSSQVVKDSLQRKYPELKDRIVNNYFGYMNKVDLLPSKSSEKLRIVYGGAFSWVQSPEILARAIDNIKDIEIFFIGNYRNYKPIKKYIGQKNIHFLGWLSPEEYSRFVMENTDVGFLSLTNDYLGACVPSKLYDYINLGLPILGALPEGDVRNIINQSGYGIAVDWRDLSGLKSAIEKFKDILVREKFRHNILGDRDSWSMEERIKEVIEWLKKI